MFRLAASGCLMRRGARMPNAQQSVAQATTTGLALYNCSYKCMCVHTHIHKCTRLYTIVRTHVYNCEHSWTCLCADPNAQCSLNTMPKIWAALSHSQFRLFCSYIAQFFGQIYHVKIPFSSYKVYSINMIFQCFAVCDYGVNYEPFTQSYLKYSE